MGAKKKRNGHKNGGRNWEAEVAQYRKAFAAQLTAQLRVHRNQADAIAEHIPYGLVHQWVARIDLRRANHAIIVGMLNKARAAHQAHINRVEKALPPGKLIWTEPANREKLLPGQTRKVLGNKLPENRRTVEQGKQRRTGRMPKAPNRRRA